MASTVLVHFLTDYDHHDRHLTIAYKAGMVIEVALDCAERAMELGLAEQADEDPIFDPEDEGDDA